MYLVALEDGDDLDDWAILGVFASEEEARAAMADRSEKTSLWIAAPGAEMEAVEG